MRILVLIHEYPPVGGGGGRVAQDLCEGLAALKHQVYVLTAHFGDLPYLEENGNLTIRRLRSGRKQAYRAGLQAMLGYVLAAIWNGFWLIKQWKPDVIHVHFAVPAGAAAWGLSTLTGIPYVLTAHLGDVPGTVPEKTGGWFRWIYPLTPMIWKKASTVTAVSEFTRESAQKYYHVPIQVIFNGVDLQSLNPGEIQINAPPRILFAGRLMQQKNPVRIIEILAELKDLDWRLMIAGDGPLKTEIENAIQLHNLADRVSMPGWITPQQVITEFAASDILLMPSLSEGLPVVGVQAAAMGLVLVLSKVGGNIDLVEPGINGFLFDAQDLDGFANCLRSLLENPERLLAMRKASRTLAEKFDIRGIIADYQDVFYQAVHERENL